MEEKKKMKNSVKVCIILGCIILAVGIGGLVWFLNSNTCEDNMCIDIGEYQKIGYYGSLSEIDKNIIGNKYMIITEYNQYDKVLKDVEEYYKKFYKLFSDQPNKIPERQFNKQFFNNNALLAIEYCSRGKPNLYTEIISFSTEENVANVKMYVDSVGSTADVLGNIYFIPISKNITSANIEYEYEEYNDDGMVYKPIIYMYPTKDTEVLVKLLKEENITCVYPEYKQGWNVLAKPNGDLIDLNTNRQLYALYYESEIDKDIKIENEGFIVKGADTSKFLEEKLDVLGLTPREAQEFIVYWLPKLEANKYNYIRFATMDEINEFIPLEITPTPDKMIRVLMTFKGLEQPIDVEEQQLTTPQRTGFTVVEWGGTEIE